ncbi:MAG: hypothetical protein ACKVS5_07045 [Parvularculaceae bacterium]
MANSHDLSDASPSEAGSARVRFRAVAPDSGTDADVDAGPLSGPARFETFAAAEMRDRGGRYQRLGRELETASRYVAIFVFFVVLVGWPLGSLWGFWSATGSAKGWSIGSAYTAWAIALGLIVPVCFWVLGYIASRMMAMIGAGRAIMVAAQRFVEPDAQAIRNVETVGTVVRGQMDALNAGIDDALIRLASVEAMIRQHVGAIEHAGLAIESRATGAADRVAVERSRLIDLTETLNERADDFATAIAEKAQANILSLQNASGAVGEAETRLEERLGRLESAAHRALQSFEALSVALIDTDGRFKASAGAIETSSAEMRAASERANRIADAAAESAARNASNVGQFSLRAAEDAKKSADAAIEIARTETDRSATAAVEFTTRESRRVAEAAARAVDSVRQATMSAVEAAAGDAEKAANAANLVSEAARRATQAAREASEDVAKAGAFARKNADEAVAIAENAGKRVDERNKELAAARAALETENARLESLIEEQRKRADRLADAIATQTERLSKLAENQLREQEASARLAEAQLAIEKNRAAEALRDAERAAEGERARRPAEAERAAKAEAERLAAQMREDEQRKAEADKAASGKAKRAEAPQSPDRSNVLDLGKSAKQSGAARLDAIAAEIERPKASRGQQTLDRGTLGEDEEKRSKHDVSWREILSATDDAEPLDLGAAERRSDTARSAAANAMKIIATLQSFTLDLETRLYGEPPPALLERFERGDRNVFANRLLRLNESDVKRRIRAEGGRDKMFERGIHEFLQGFERLLEDATTSETADEELEQYLSSPLGRVYLLVGATVGYFA